MNSNSLLAEAQKYLCTIPAVLDGAVTLTLAKGPDDNLTRVCASSGLNSYDDRCTLIETPDTAQQLAAAAARAAAVQLAHACMWEDDALIVDTIHYRSEPGDEDITAASYSLPDTAPERAVSVRVAAPPSGGIENISLFEPGDEEGLRIRLRTYDRLPDLLRERQDDWEADQAESL